MSRVENDNNNEQQQQHFALRCKEREFVGSSPPKKEFFPFVLKSFLLKEKLTKSVRRSFYLLLSNNTLFHQTKTEAKNEQTRRG